MNLPKSLELTDEQKEKLAAFIAEEREKAVKEYVAGAQRFRTWLRTKDQVWVAQRVFTSVISIELLIAFAIWLARR